MSARPPDPDFILSSGFLAFGRQAGFLAGTIDVGIHPHKVFGTSSGALVGAMFCAGMSITAILEEVQARRPISWMGLSLTPWRGVFHLAPMIARLHAVLPERFEDLDIPLAVGVQRADGGFAFVDSGPLPPVVAASCAMPWVFQPVKIELDGGLEACADGGAADRLGISAWRGLPDRAATAIVHLVERTAGAQVQVELGDLTVVRSGRSGAHFWNLGGVDDRARETRRSTHTVLSEAAGSNGDESSRNPTTPPL